MFELDWGNLYIFINLALLMEDLPFHNLQVSDLINCGVYVFTPAIFRAIQNVSNNREDRGQYSAS